MNLLDILLAVMILLGAYSGYKDGFVVSLFSVIAVVLGVLAGFKFMGNLMVFLANKYNIDEKILPYFAFGLVFIIVIVVVNLLGKLIKSALNKPLLGAIDNFGGALFGLLRAAFMLSIVLWILDSLKVVFPAQLGADSWLHPKIASFAPNITNWMSDVFPIFKGVF